MQQKINSADYLNQQYSDSSNLQARIDLHQKYSVDSPESWYRWLVSQLEWQPNDQILICGGGPGKVWEANLDRLPLGAEITLTDFSAGMVEEAQHNLRASTQFKYETASIESLPFDDNSFDRVTANHMLYHVPNIDKAIAEVRRVLKPDGLFLAATNGSGHLHELRQLGQILAPNSYWQTRGELPFRLENGADFLAPHFPSVELRPFQGAIAVAEFEPLFAYLNSYGDAREQMTEETLDAAHHYFRQQLDADGYFHVKKESGVFVAR